MFASEAVCQRSSTPRLVDFALAETNVADVTEEPTSENAALNVPLPTMSVPTRSQSGSRAAFRIHSCRSGENGVPGATIGRGADSQRK